MSRKSSDPPRIAPLQCVVAEPITDPAAQAALDKLRKREKRKQTGRKGKATGDDARSAANAAAKRRR